LVSTAAASRGAASLNVMMRSISRSRDREQLAPVGDQPEAQELAREDEVLLQQREAAEQSRVVGQQRLVVAEARLLDPRGAHVDEHRVAELVEMTQVDARAPAENLLVKHRRVGLGADQVEGQGGDWTAGKQAERILARRPRRFGSSSRRGAVRTRSVSRRPAAKSPSRPSACNGPGRGVILGAGELERPDREVAAQRVAAVHVLVALAIDRVEVGAALDGLALAQARIAEHRIDPRQHRRGRGRKEARQQLLDQVVGEFRESRA
jgi:hypothetical protein